MERLIKYNLARHYFQIGVIFCPKTNNICCKKNPHGIAVGITVVHLYVEFRYRYTYIHIWISTWQANAKLKRGGGSSGYDYCPRKIHTAALRVAASPGPRGWSYTSSDKSTWFVLSCKQYTAK